MTLHIEGLNPLFFILAYAGMLLHFLMKLAEVFNLPDFSFKIFFKRNIIPLLISIIGIPVLLIVATDASIKDILPINYVTSVLAGWQTQSLFKTLFALYGKKRGLSTDSYDNDKQDPNTPG